MYIYIYTRFQKGFHMERYIDRYILLFSCTCARVHFSLVIVQHVKNLVLMRNFLSAGFFVWICEKRKECTNPVGNSFHLHTPGNKRMGNLVSYRLSTVVVTRWAFLRQSVFTTIPPIKERLSGKSFKISIFTTTPLKWKRVFSRLQNLSSRKMSRWMTWILGMWERAITSGWLKRINTLMTLTQAGFITNTASWSSLLKKKREHARARNGNYRPLGMVGGLFSFTSIAVISCLCFF